LRASGFLPAAALQASRVAVFSSTPQTRALASLRAVLSSSLPSIANRQLLLLTGSGLAAPATSSNGAGAHADILSPELLSTDATAANLATAISDANTRGATRIVVFGVNQDEVDGDSRLRAAIDSIQGNGGEVCFLAAAKRNSPGLLDYLLPGLGGTERLTALGREAARTFLQQNGRRRPR